jgi:hypothetical protein
MFNEKDILTLSDDNKYAVVSKCSLDNKIYYYLMDIDSLSVKFCFERNNKLVEVNDRDELERLVSIFSKNMRKELREIKE